MIETRRLINEINFFLSCHEVNVRLLLKIYLSTTTTNSHSIHYRACNVRQCNSRLEAIY